MTPQKKIIISAIKRREPNKMTHESTHPSSQRGAAQNGAIEKRIFDDQSFESLLIVL